MAASGVRDGGRGIPALPEIRAADGRRRRHRATSRAITVAAQSLAATHGLDGFTMDQLAHAVGLSRRTLFNYFSGKEEAVLGEMPVVEETSLATFRAGGPTGHLLLDLAGLATEIIGSVAPTPAQMRIGRDVFTKNPRLLSRDQERFEAYVAQFRQEISSREGYAASDVRPRLAVAIVVALYEVALEELVSGRSEGDLATAFAATLQGARSLVG